MFDRMRRNETNRDPIQCYSSLEKEIRPATLFCHILIVGWNSSISRIIHWTSLSSCALHLLADCTGEICTNGCIVLSRESPSNAFA
mmetsp:Transcript_25299/g.69750  ORF Transcript_25299/g.69750 Transcript_25299/m.69750 type:complete len:86 (+) Transcript_25299:262-519(+)